MDIEEVNSLIDDYKALLESYKKENKHLKDLQKNMDKQYAELEDNWNGLKKYVIDLFNKTQHILYLDILDKILIIESGKNE